MKDIKMKDTISFKEMMDDMIGIFKELENNPRYRHKCPKCKYQWSSIVLKPKKCPKCQKRL